MCVSQCLISSDYRTIEIGVLTVGLDVASLPKSERRPLLRCVDLS